MGSANRNNRVIMSFIDQLKRRNVFRVGIAYLIVAWLIAQVTELALDSFAAPNWVMKTVLFLLVIGFPLALFLAWAFELTPDGIKLDKDVVRSEHDTHLPGRKFDFVLIGLLLLAVTFLVVDNYGLDNATDRSISPDAEHSLQPATLERMAFPLPDKPSIVVLPFDNMSGVEEQEYFVDGITEDLTTDLSKLPGLFVIARNSAFTYKGRPVSHKRVAEELGVQYIVEGSVRRDGDQIRINAQVIDALSGHHVWAERYDGSLKDVFALQDNVVAQIVSALAINVRGVERAMTLVGGTDKPEAYMAALQGWDHHHRQTSEDAAKAVSFFKRAVELDPGYSRAYAGLGRTYWEISNVWWFTNMTTNWQSTFDLARENLALAMREPTADAYALSAEINARMGNHEQALSDIDRAIALGPSVADNTIVKARILNAVGRAEEAEDLTLQAMRLDPYYTPAYARVLGHSLLHQERYAAAARHLEMATSREGMNPYDFVSLAVAYGYLERLTDAGAAVDNYQKLILEYGYSTPLTVQESDKWWYGDMFDYDKTYKEGLMDGLRRAGVPEGPAPADEDFDYRLLMSRDAEILSVEGAITIDVDTAKELLDRGVTFVDVRDKLAFNAGHMPGAIHLDLHVDFTAERLSEFVDRNDEVVMSCWGINCPYGAHASAKAVTWGYSQVKYFAGGFPAWLAAGYSVEDAQD
jgi:TolB-like protein/rhodanese-related sulfurtransferase/Flp pilus assembly protein TadD